jgi:hypothetical protein
MTPEGKVKEKVKKLLTLYPNLYRFMPVQAGFGTPSLDILGCHWGRFFAVETKRSGKALTPMQEKTRDQMRAAGGMVFEVIGDDGLEELAHWLKEIDDAARGSFTQA